MCTFIESSARARTQSSHAPYACIFELGSFHAPACGNARTPIIADHPHLPGPQLDLATMVWTDVTGTALGTPPSARWGHGFASANGNLVVFGGFSGLGTRPQARPWTKSVRTVSLPITTAVDAGSRARSREEVRSEPWVGTAISRRRPPPPVRLLAPSPGVVIGKRD